MKDRGIIFSAPMVRALLEGRKTQTRRLATSQLRKCVPGDRLWVRESFRHWQGSASRKTACYAADGVWIDHGSGWTGTPDDITWLTPATSSRFMPRWASRITLLIDEVRFQNLHDITLADEIAEGAPIDHGYRPLGSDEYTIPMVATGIASWQTPRAWYHSLWDSLHGNGSWDANPEVVAITFTVVRDNIDRIENS